MTENPEEIRQKAQNWLNSTQLDVESRSAIEEMLQPGHEEQLNESFYKDLEFGTGGLRGIMGVGSNRMNRYTIGMATQGLANYLLKTYPDQPIQVAIAHDSRNNSRYFAEVTAGVFSANGIKVHLFEQLRPTPELSFAIRRLGCQSGVVVTASHNPKEYNGYKAYWNDGAQVVPPHDKNIISEVKAIQNIDEVKFEAREDLIQSLGSEMDEAYLEDMVSRSLAQDSIARHKDLKIVFSPIHGTGITMVPPALERFGFNNVHVVEEQAEPNGDFPTVVYPNPEEREAMRIALAQAEEIDADLVMATDPDSDRVGIGCKNHHGEWQLLNGNQTAALLTYYLIRKWEENGKLDGRQYIVNTIVTTELIDRIGEHYGVKVYHTLTGFKWIAEVIREREGEEIYIGGGEESYGYLVGDAVRDKDAVSACAFIAEMCAYFQDQGLDLFDTLIDMYRRFGFYYEDLISITKKGQKGSAEISEMMARLRNDPPETLGGSKVIRLLDYQSLQSKDLGSGETENLDFPKSNVLQFITESGSKVSARPSGTEPKIKFYVSVNEALGSIEDFDRVADLLKDRIKAIQSDLGLVD